MSSVQAIIERQLRRWEMEKQVREQQPARDAPAPPPQPIVTVSRERGSGGSRVAELVAQRFDYTLLHHDVIDRICNSANLRRSLVESLDEHVKSEITTWCDAMIAQRYTDSSDYVRFLLETIRSLASLGGVVVVGRGANFIVGPAGGFHVRVVAPREQRIQRLVEHDGLTSRQAAHEVEARDRERAEFIRKLHGRDSSDPAAYDLVLNTGSLTLDEAADVVAAAAHLKFERLRVGTARAATATR